MQTALLDIQDLTFAVGQQKILNGLGVVIQPQEIHVLLGANGSGKTALAYLLMGCEGYVSSAGQVQSMAPPFFPSRGMNGPSWA